MNLKKETIGIGISIDKKMPIFRSMKKKIVEKVYYNVV